MDIDISKIQKLKDNLPFFAGNFFIIKSKSKGITKLSFNDIQIDFHNKITERKRSVQPCKFVVVKARQLGLSTYIEARLFHRILFETAKNAYILADKHDTASSIFAMTKLYYDELPAGLKIPLENNSSKILSLSTKSLIRVGTAGADVIGRGTTNNFFHGSECAFWKNAAEIVSGILQTIPESLDSEIYLESTTNGTTGDGLYFYEMAMIGLDDKSEFQTIFYPWFANKEYTKPLIEPLQLDDYEKFLVKTYSLTDEQLNWRRNKLTNEFKTRPYLFKQEYPSNISEAFLKNNNSLIAPEYIETARKNTGITGNNMPVIIGVDPARSSDRTIITIRQGRVIQKFYKFDVMDNIRLAGILLRLINAVNPARVFIDYGHGDGVYDILSAQGAGNILELVQFGSQAYDTSKYMNRRAEMYDKMRDWFIKGAYIKDTEYIDEFIRDISIIPDLKVSDSNGRYSLEKKANIVKGTDVHSTDFADSLALTFASPVAFNAQEKGFNNNQIQIINKNWQQRL